MNLQQNKYLVFKFLFVFNRDLKICFKSNKSLQYYQFHRIFLKCAQSIRSEPVHNQQSQVDLIRAKFLFCYDIIYPILII
jgi:hypothetical protein